MLFGGEFHCEKIADLNSSGLSLPIIPGDEIIAIGRFSDHLMMVILNAEDRTFPCFPVQKAYDRLGLIIPNFSIRVDETSAILTEKYDAPLGTIVRTGAGFSILAKPVRTFSTALVSISDQLKESPVAIGFTRWEFTIGEGDDIRRLYEIDVGS